MRCHPSLLVRPLLSVALLLGGTPAALAFCDGMGMASLGGFDCDDGGSGLYGPGGVRSSFQRDNGSVGFFGGPAGSPYVSDDRGGGALILGEGRSRTIVTDDGRSGTVAQQGNSLFFNLDSPYPDESWPPFGGSGWSALVREHVDDGGQGLVLEAGIHALVRHLDEEAW